MTKFQVGQDLRPCAAVAATAVVVVEGLAPPAAAAAVAALGPAAAVLGPAVATCMCVAVGAGKATWRRTAQRRPTSGAGAQVKAGRCLVSGLCWQA